ncbi:MAG: hypothetical protein HRF52_02340 [Ignavibacterium sp.]|jgi:hypothetical protein|uniref:hypothetical protein n=1 Tax=Ignavibacterium sp. TaxID=2651167 RepID=UPI0032995387
MKNLIIIIAFVVGLFIQSCSEPTTPDNGGEPTPPRWIDLSIKIDSLPAANKTGSIQSTFIVKGLGDKMPVFYDSLQNKKDTLNYIRISFNPDPGGERYTIMSGDTAWEGKVAFLDTIVLNTQFKPLKTPYWTIAGSDLREFNWVVDFIIGFYYKNANGDLIVFWGNLDPSLSNPQYATLYVNTNNGDTFLKIHAQN